MFKEFTSAGVPTPNNKVLINIDQVVDVKPSPNGPVILSIGNRSNNVTETFADVKAALGL